MCGSYKNFEENFQECCAQSQYCLDYQLEQSDEQYKRVNAECQALYSSIEALLGDDSLVDQFDGAKNRAAAFREQAFYHQGYYDCIFLLRWLGLISL